MFINLIFIDYCCGLEQSREKNYDSSSSSSPILPKRQKLVSPKSQLPVSKCTSTLASDKNHNTKNQKRKLCISNRHNDISSTVYFANIEKILQHEAINDLPLSQLEKFQSFDSKLKTDVVLMRRLVRNLFYKMHNL